MRMFLDWASTRIENIKPYSEHAIGPLLVLALYDQTFGLPLLLIYILLIIKPTLPDKLLFLLQALFAIKIIWIVGINFYFKRYEWIHIVKIICPDLLFIFLSLYRISTDALSKIIKSIFVLFIIDFFFNFYTYFTGTDLLGRTYGLRPYENSLRLGGIFGNPIYTVTISVVTILCGFAYNYRIISLFAFVNLAINSTQRAPLTIIVLLYTAFLLYKKVGSKVYYTALSLVPVAVVLVTSISAALLSDQLHLSGDSFKSGNMLRVDAWISSVTNIINNPILGTHSFKNGIYAGELGQVITDYGVAESQYLQYAVDFGLLPMIIALFVSIYLMVKARNAYLLNSTNYFFACALGTSFVFIDSFYGCVYGGTLFTFVYYSLILNAYKR